MKRFIAALTCAFFSAGILWGQEVTKAESGEPESAANRVSVDKLNTGENVLLVKYPWRMHAKASIELRLIAEKKDFAARVRPLHFAAIRFDDLAARRIFEAFDKALDRPSDWEAEAGGLKWRIVANGNHLGRAAAWFFNAPRKDSPLRGTTAAFCPLDSRAINDGLLLLDLPRDSFAEPGKLHVWFLRSERIFWHEELLWPGRR